MASGAVQRRQLLKLLGAGGLGLPLVGEARGQQAVPPTLFLEVDLRIQMDLMHVMVPPSIAKYPNRQVGSNGDQLTMFAPQSELKEYPNNVFLTNDSLELAPHLDSVAMLDTGQMSNGNVHGLEAGCGMRSPGRTLVPNVEGHAPMWLLDGEHAAGSEEIYANVPTPATLHNYYQRLLTPGLRNGYAFKGIARSKYNVYHFAGNLAGAELDRIRSKDELFAAFESDYRDALPPGELAQLPPYVKRGGGAEQALLARAAALEGSLPSLALSPEEEAYWSSGVPPMRCSIGDFEVIDCPATDPSADEYVKAQIWEQFAHATKLFRAGVVRSIALEFSYGHLDGDGVRTEQVLREQAQQVARPLARFIAQMKEAGLYERTLVAIYLVDGSRTPGANSYGDNGKGTFLLAGGKIKGGYYGDIGIDSDLPNGAGHTYSFRTPDPASGQLEYPQTIWGSHGARTQDASVWRTVAKALGIPESDYIGKYGLRLDSYPPLDCMLRS